MRLSFLVSAAITALAAIAAAIDIDTNTTVAAISTDLGVLPSFPTQGPTIANYLTVVDGPLVTLKFSTSYPHNRNWIGVWKDYHGGPKDQSWVAEQLAWTWASGTTGTVQVDISNLRPGRYAVYFLAQGSYKWLAKPVEVFVPGTGPMRFIPRNFTTQNARVGDAFKADISGLLTSVQDTKTIYSVTDRSRSNWVSISNNGVITGVPEAAGDSRFTVIATGSGNITAVLPVFVPVVSRGHSLTSKLKVLTFNLWQGGRNINDFHRKQVKFLAELNVDVVALQESYFQDGLRLAKALGWYVWQSRDVATMTRYPIAQVYREIESGGTIRVAVDGKEKQVIVWNVHFNDAPYGPYDLCFTNYSINYVQKREKWSRRHQQMFELDYRMELYQSQKEEMTRLPHILAGTFNTPSHLDWVNKSSILHCQKTELFPFPWPVSLLADDRHWRDSYREAWPDPFKNPGFTWSPTRRLNGDRPEPMDRIDYIYHQRLKTIASDTVLVGAPQHEPYHIDNDWTSDHAAVVTTFKVPKTAKKGWYDM